MWQWWWCWCAGAAVLLAAGSQARVCRSIDIRKHVEMFEKLRGCRVVEGFLQVLLITIGEHDLPRLQFPELVEVTDYMLVYRVRGLTSLASLFPNLAVIRGHELFSNFALIVFENFHLTQVGLHSLTSILRGAVNIYKNKKLCYVDTVDWSRLSNRKHSFGQNQNTIVCTTQQNCSQCEDGHCWGGDVSSSCQKSSPVGCHPECLGGCSGPGPRDCIACRHVEMDGTCLHRCPIHRYEYLERRCVTGEECRSIPKSDISQLKECELEPSKNKRWIPYAGMCSQACPPDHQPLGESCEPCRGHCQTFCGNGEVVNVTSLACVQSLKHCNYINGSLVIHLHASDEDIVKELEENLSGIEEIDGFLEVSRSVSLKSLRFLKGLRVIHGKQLESGKSALVVRNNPNLERLFPLERMNKLEVLGGRLKFHDNPMLCLTEINTLQKFSGLANYTSVEVSIESNGNGKICKTISLSVEYSVINSTCVEICWRNIVQLQKQTLLGYTIHYVEANDFNVSMDSAMDDTCGDDGWRVEYVITHTQEQVSEKTYQSITNLKPFTRYAFFVKTYNIAPEAETGIGPLLYFKTHPDRPAVPRSLTVLHSSSSEITLVWETPLLHNGKLTHYIIIGKRYLDSKSQLINRDFCNFPMEVPRQIATLNISTQNSNRTSCCEKKICASGGLSSQFNFIFKEGTAKVEEELCGQPNALYSILYSNRLFGEQGSFVNHYELGGPLFNKSIEEYFKSEYNYPPMEGTVDDTVRVTTAGMLTYFIKKVSALSSSATVKNLAHYGEYSMKIVACRAPYMNESDDNWFQIRCSPASLIHARTQLIETADDINPESVKIKFLNDKIFVSWDSPQDPNGIIVKYDIAYRRTNDEHVPSLLCVTLAEFNYSGGLIELPNLAPGRYEVSIRATSLAGPGKFTLPVSFRVDSTVAFPNTAVVMSSIAFVVLIVTLFGGYFWHKLQKERQRQRLLYTIANPEYVSLGSYVEDEWEIARDKVEFLKELSHGSFGTVYEGILRPINVRCAVKTVNEKATVYQKLEFLNEASVMKSFTEAHHVVKLLGVVSKGQPPLVIMELMANGDLKSYLRSARDDESRKPTSRRVIKMAAEIADGMAYLEASKFVHRDLAARNCMIDDDLTVKIGDFGMTRDIYETDYYRKESKGLVPVRWMAPESLGDGVFTNKSDVWSYGVVLWEIITLAEQPHQGLSNEQVLQFVLAGGCLEHPDNCPELLHYLMTCCWRRKANHRPTFLQILDLFESSTSGLDEDFRQVSFYHSEAGVELRSKYDFRAHEEELINLLVDTNSISSGEWFIP